MKALTSSETEISNDDDIENTEFGQSKFNFYPFSPPALTIEYSVLDVVS